MSDPVSLASLFESAERAAVDGDFAAASRLLAEAARAQEITLGPDHLDLANTLNNLAVAHERCGQLDAAEREYRRAHAIAARTRPADDPLVTTSAQNLRDFCQANGRPVDGPALRLAADGDPGAEAARAVAIAEPSQADVPTAPIERLAITFATDTPAAAPRAREPLAPSPASRPAPVQPSAARPSAPAPSPAAKAPAPSRSAGPALTPAREPIASAAAGRESRDRAAAVAARRLPVSIPVLIALGALAVLMIWLLAGRGPASPPAAPEAAAPDTTAAAPAPARAAPPAAASAPPPGAAVAAAARPADGIEVAEARLCTALSPGYRCDPAGATVRPGRLVFYTRLTSARDTSVVHRWYRGSDLRQAIRLDVPARRQGFRTYSRGTVTASDGEWRVEVRSRDGQVLHTERFTVR